MAIRVEDIGDKKLVTVRTHDSCAGAGSPVPPPAQRWVRKNPGVDRGTKLSAWQEIPTERCSADPGSADPATLVLSAC